MDEMDLAPRRTGGTLLGALLVLSTAVIPAPATATPPDPSEGHGPDCRTGDPGWEFSTEEFDTTYTRHAYVGNGYLSQRVPPTGTGYVATGGETGFPLETPRFDGAFVSGLYGSGPSAQTDEDKHAIAAIPTWSTLTVDNGTARYGAETPEERISDFRQTLNVRCGILRTSLTWTTPDGRATELDYEIVADRAHPHAGAVRLRMTPHWNGRATVTAALDGDGARRMEPTGAGTDGRTVHVGFRTDEVATTGTLASTLRAGGDLARAESERSTRVSGLDAEQSLSFSARAGHTYEFGKYVGVDTALTAQNHRDSAVDTARRAAARGWDRLFAEHAERWRSLWSGDIRTPGRPRMQRWLRASKYALLSSIRRGQDNSIAPAGLSSDNYAGLIFWDAELWMYPALLAQHPALARSVVAYRERTLDQARANAEVVGQRGAFYPWTSADSGDLDDDCHSWDPPHCLTQNHLQGDIALATWQYYQASGDRRWLREHGWPVLRALARYWEGRVTRNDDGSYSIHNVAGPDEYSNGVDDGVFTNAGAATALRNATRAADVLGEPAPARWTEIADGLRIPFDEERGVFLQYAGYDGGEIKQADTVLLQYPLEWPMSEEVATDTLEYYAPRTDPDGPAMTDAVHAVDAAANGQPGCVTNTYVNRAIRPFVRAPFAQFSEARGERAGDDGGSPALNFLTGNGGFLQTFTHGLTGLRWRTDAVRMDPTLPPQFPRGVELTGLHWQGRTFDVRIGPEHTRVALRHGDPFTVRTPDGEHTVGRGAPATIETRRPDLAPTDNLARCRPATAADAEPGKYAEAAVDGSTATTWTPASRRSELTVELEKPSWVGEVRAEWTDTAPKEHRVLVSVDGRHFTEFHPWGPPRLARYVRVEVTSPPQAQAGIRELRVTAR
ncbi:glycosyl hydrolase family 65 protein [Actinopolyspora mortivallis]|uniref:glycosyl hydrolase family 65 protein n=1 Tax=Actinopolyspora mortivallis TaxID=33906 RepID=UPI000367A082